MFNIGDYSEAMAISSLLRKGYKVFTQTHGTTPGYDLIFETSTGKLVKGQVKTAHYRNGSVTFDTRRKPKGVPGVYTSDEVDVFIAYCHELERSYLVPFAVANKRGTSLRVDPPKRASGNIKWAKDYEI